MEDPFWRPPTADPSPQAEKGDGGADRSVSQQGGGETLDSVALIPSPCGQGCSSLSWGHRVVSADVDTHMGGMPNCRSSWSIGYLSVLVGQCGDPRFYVLGLDDLHRDMGLYVRMLTHTDGGPDTALSGSQERLTRVEGV